MQNFPYELTGPIGSRATFGHIVLQVDETLEQDMRRLLPGGEVAHHVSRIPSGDELTPDTIATMKETLPAAAALLPPAAEFDVIGYCCTSGTTLIGADRVADLVRQGAAATHVTDPLTAALAALATLEVRSLALVSPYVESVSDPVRQAFAARGYDVSGTVSFGEEVEARVARIDPASIHAAALSVAGDADAVFLSCTNLRTLNVIEAAEDKIEKPVLSSNQALIWHLGQLGGFAAEVKGIGRLFEV